MKLSVLIPFRRADAALRQQLVRLERELLPQHVPCELVLVAEGPGGHLPHWLFAATSEEVGPKRQVVRLRRPQGPAAAVAAAILAARGELLVLVAPGAAYPPSLVEELLNHLVRADLVWARRRRRGWRRLGAALRAAPSRLVLGPLVRDPECLLWAARAEVFQGLEQALAFVPVLPWWVAAQGYRVTQVTISPQGPQRYRVPVPWPWQLLAARTLLRRSEPVQWERVASPAANTQALHHPDPSTERNKAA